MYLKRGNYSPVFRPFRLLYLLLDVPSDNSLRNAVTQAPPLCKELSVVSLGGDRNGENSSEAKGNADIVNPWPGLEISAVVQGWLLFPKMILDKLKSESQLEYPLGRCHREN